VHEEVFLKASRELQPARFTFRFDRLCHEEAWMPGTLIIYGSTYGQTERVAHRIARVLRDAGHVADVYNGDHLPGTVSLTGYDSVVIAASVRFGRHQKYIRRYVRRHAEELNAHRTAFVSVCGAAGGAPRRAQGYIEDLLRETGWRPAITQSFTGAVAYTKYGWMTRWIMTSISRRKGLPVDTSKDWDYTEWDEVDRFAAELAEAWTPNKVTLS
jgi:menaquinone-dependent protoporphyrinogen oxidase